MNPLEESIEAIKRMQKTVEDTVKKCDDVKDGINTKEEEMKEPKNLLFTKISENIIEILQNPDIINGFAVISENGFATDATGALINIIAITAVSSAFNAITFYDELLKEELTKQFDHIGNHVNRAKADIEGIMAACEVYKVKIGEIEKKLMLDDKTNIN